MIGAVISMVQVICTSSWICWTSLVVRVSSDGAPKRAVSAAEKPVTWWKIADRRSRPKPIPARDPKYTAPTAHNTCSPVTASITPPSSTMVVGVALGDAVVDDRGVDRGQVQRSQGADHLQHRDDGEQPAVRPHVLPQQCQEHPVTVAHHPVRLRYGPATRLVRAKMPGQSCMSVVALRWLPLQCMRCDSPADANACWPWRSAAR